MIPEPRVRPLNLQPIQTEGQYVLYWMVAARRLEWSFALDRALDHARRLGRPLLILEALRCDYGWASDRLHRFVLEGMAEHSRRLAGTGIGYHPYVEPAAGAGRGLLESLAAKAAVVVTDDFPCFFLPRMVEAAGARLGVLLEAVDGNGLLPLRAASRVFTLAHSFRRYLQQELPRHLDTFPTRDPFAGPPPPPFGRLSEEIERRWPAAAPELLAAGPAVLSRLPIDHGVGPAAIAGGAGAAAATLERFLATRLGSYGEGRNHPDDDAASGLSPYLHFGHLSAHQVFAAVMGREGWHRSRIAARPNGSRHGFWGASAAVESFLDELLTWRELGYNLCWQVPAYDRYESLPDWARATLERHADDPRPTVYSGAELAAAETHDPVWNAAQRQLVREGRMHNYLRMLWGKKVLEWTRSPEQAVEVLIELNNRYAVDGRNPNSYTGIFWCFGRYDRPWAPERPIFGTIRYMSSAATVRKLRMKAYLQRYGP